MGTKKAAILCLCVIVVSACACNNANNNSLNSETGSVLYSQIGSVSESEISTDKIDITEAAITTTTAETNGTEKRNKVADIKLDSVIDENDDSILARDFIRDYTLCILERDKEIIELDKYFDNKYLKEYVKENIKSRCNNSQWYTDYEKYMDQGWILSVVLLEENKKDNIDYYTLSCYFNGASELGGWGIHRPCVGIRDGKVVNFNDWYFMDSYANFWDENITQDMIYHSYYLYLYSNPWDNECVAEKAVGAYEKYLNKEYETYKDAWNSLGE